MGKTVNTMQIDIISRFRFHRRSWRRKIYFWWNILPFWKSVPISSMCQKQTSVSFISTELEIISLDARLRLGRIVALHLRDLIEKILDNTIQNHDRTEQPIVDSDKNHEASKSKLEKFSMFWMMFTLFLQTSNLLIKKLCCVCSRTTEQWSRRLKKRKKTHIETCFQDTQICSWKIVRSNN